MGHEADSAVILRIIDVFEPVAECVSREAVSGRGPIVGISGGFGAPAVVRAWRADAGVGVRVSQAGQEVTAPQTLGTGYRPVMHGSRRIDPPRPRLLTIRKLETSTAQTLMPSH